MEVKREVARAYREYLKCVVSILVLMEVKRESLPRLAMLKLSFVSILVLMEVKREQFTLHARMRYTLCFNPCFDGSEARDRSTWPK